MLEMWMGLPGYGSKKEQPADGEGVQASSEGGPVLSKLRRALNLKNSAEDALKPEEDGRNGNVLPASIALDLVPEVCVNCTPMTLNKAARGGL